jgi:hypothetical protein
MDIVQEFIDVNQRLFAICDEQTALKHIATLREPDAKALAKTLWQIEKIERQMREARDWPGLRS